MSDREITSYAQFWPYYLGEHARPGTRAWHYTGTGLAILALLLAPLARLWWLLIAVPVAGYLFAWIGHWRVERNRPATFTYPLWSLMSDLRMFGLAMTGQLARELARHGIEPGGEPGKAGDGSRESRP